MSNPLGDLWFENVPMGQRFRLVTLPAETGGERFVREYLNRPRMGKYAIPEHFHPTWTETFEIVKGRARYRLGRVESEAEAGTRVVLPPNVRHLHPWSASDEELVVIHTAVADPPDLRGLTASLQGIVTIFELAGRGKVKASGAPGLLQLAVIAERTMPATFVPGPPPSVQRVAIKFLAALGRWRGYRAVYPGIPVVPEHL